MMTMSPSPENLTALSIGESFFDSDIKLAKIWANNMSEDETKDEIGQAPDIDDSYHKGSEGFYFKVVE